MMVMKWLGITSLLVLAISAQAEDITGKPRIIDGDTIEIAGERIRLHGIDAPEKDQPCEWPGIVVQCGQKATLALSELIGGSEVTCHGDTPWTNETISPLFPLNPVIRDPA